jgi:chemotaxis protein methyltransferase CheR
MTIDAAEEIETRLLLEAIFARYGYDLREYEPLSMGRRVKAALSRSGLRHRSELTHQLLNQPELFASVLDDLMVQVTEMFRDPSAYLSFRECVVPILRTYPEIRVWHAGCASGEEVYATAILLSEEGLYERTQIYATDLNEAAVERAREGVYSEPQAALFAKNYRAAGGKSDFSDYCSSGYGRMIMREHLRRNLVFFQHSLVSDYALGEMNVIFCRNVLIYFNTALRQRVFRIFQQGLCPGGFLCLGQSESVPQGDAGFREFERSAHIYRRGQA